MNNQKHIGNNLRALRMLRGMKQETFARQFGIAQQNVSKMEKKKDIPEEQLEQAAKILQTTVEQIKEFDEKSIFQTNIINENQVNNFNSTKEILEYFESKLEKKENEIRELRQELEMYKSKRKSGKSAAEDVLHTVPGKNTKIS